ncbi:MAG: T9SS type A sorting domain-containing protein, partial [Candidatus Cloacimonetes bacterium]|nr:T9SS type A sorting domain-containing protein [Candidatus Cloacimonadota bacterium]
KNIACFALLTLLCTASAIDWLPGPGGPAGGVRPQADLCYHSGNDDQHWYGASRWAVFFDIGSLYTGFEDLEFEATEALIYFPSSVANDTATATLYDDNPDHQPGDELATVTLSGDLQGWQTFTFPQSVTSGGMWLVLDYATTPDQRWVSASIGEGEHSWWWDPDYGDNGWFRNNQQTGFGAEFLFGLNGVFNFGQAVIDIELVNVGLSGTQAPGSRVSPVYTLRNNSPVDWGGLDFEVSMYYPDTTGEEPYENTDDDIVLLARQTLTDTTSFNIVLPDYPCQFTLATEVTNEDTSGVQANNSIEFRFDTFQQPIETILIENALRSSWPQIGEWWDVQEQLPLSDSVYVLNFFPDVADSLYRQASAWRSETHGLMGYPAAIVQNTHKIIGYAGATQLADSLEAALAAGAADRTFFSFAGFEASKWDNDDIEAILSFENSDTHVLAAYMGGMRFHAVCAQREVSLQSSDVLGSVLISRLTDDDGLTVEALQCDSTQTFAVQYNANALPVISPGATLDQLDLVYWFEHTDSRRVLQAGVIPLNTIDDIAVSVDDAPLPPPMAHLYPNPFSIERPLQISLARAAAAEHIQVDIYNVRGRRVRSLSSTQATTIEWNGRGESGRVCATGVYLIRVTTRHGAMRSQSLRRCLLIK